MASELLEYEDDEEVNENSLAGSKRGTPPTTVNSLEKKEGIQPSKFKIDSGKSSAMGMNNKIKKKDVISVAS